MAVEEALVLLVTVEEVDNMDLVELNNIKNTYKKQILPNKNINYKIPGVQMQTGCPPL